LTTSEYIVGIEDKQLQILEIDEAIIGAKHEAYEECFGEICRLSHVVEAQRQALLFWRREFDREYGREKFNNVIQGV
jgi:hypothetical protein